MRKIDELAQKEFDGDTIKALYSLVDSKQGFAEYRDELTLEEKRNLLNYVTNKVAVEKYGCRKNFNKSVVFETELQKLGITEYDIENAKENPYGKEIKKGLIYLIISSIVLVLMILFREPVRQLSVLVELIVYAALFLSLSTLAVGLIKYFKFNSLLKTYSQIEKTKSKM